MIHKPGDVDPGSARSMNELWREVDGHAQLHGLPPIVVDPPSPSGRGVMVVRSRLPGMLARLTGAGGSAYPWQECEVDAAGAIVDRSGGQSGALAYHINRRTDCYDAARDNFVILRPGGTPEERLFDMPRQGTHEDCVGGVCLVFHGCAVGRPEGGGLVTVKVGTTAYTSGTLGTTAAGLESFCFPVADGVAYHWKLAKDGYDDVEGDVTGSCGDQTITRTLTLSDNFHCSCCGRAAPDDLTITDKYGAHTISRGGTGCPDVIAGWAGSYTVTEPEAWYVDFDVYTGCARVCHVQAQDVRIGYSLVCQGTGGGHATWTLTKCVVALKCGTDTRQWQVVTPANTNPAFGPIDCTRVVGAQDFNARSVGTADDECAADSDVNVTISLPQATAYSFGPGSPGPVIASEDTVTITE